MNESSRVGTGVYSGSVVLMVGIADGMLCMLPSGERSRQEA